MAGVPDLLIITVEKANTARSINPDNNGTGGKFNDSIAGGHDRIAGPYQLKTKFVGIDQKTSHGFSFLINRILDFRNTEGTEGLAMAQIGDVVCCDPWVQV